MFGLVEVDDSSASPETLVPFPGYETAKAVLGGAKLLAAIQDVALRACQVQDVAATLLLNSAGSGAGPLRGSSYSTNRGSKT